MIAPSIISGRIGNQAVAGIKFSVSSELKATQVSSNNVVITVSNIMIRTLNISEVSSDLTLDLQLYTDTDNLGFTSIKTYKLPIESGDDTLQIPSISFNIDSQSNRDVSTADLVQLRLVVDHPDISTQSHRETLVRSGSIVKIDDFNKYRYSAWNGGTDAWSVTSNNSLTDSSLKRNGTNDGSETIYSEPTDGLGYYPKKGDIISAYHRENNATDNRIRAGIGWAIEQVSGTSLNGYGIDPQGDNNIINLVKYK